MKKIDFTQKAFIVNNGKILLVKKSGADPNHPYKWEVPGGRLEFGESPDEHIKREVKEEVGIDILPQEPFSIWNWIMKVGGDDVHVICVGRVCDPINTCVHSNNRVESDYLSEIEWVDLEKVFDYPLIPGVEEPMRKFIEIQRKKI